MKGGIGLEASCSFWVRSARKKEGEARKVETKKTKKGRKEKESAGVVISPILSNLTFSFR